MLIYAFLNGENEIVAVSKTFKEQKFEDGSFKNYLIEQDNDTAYAISANGIQDIVKLSSAIENFEPCKFKYIDKKVILNENYIDPQIERLNNLQKEYQHLLQDLKLKFGEDFTFNLNVEEE